MTSRRDLITTGAALGGTFALLSARRVEGAQGAPGNRAWEASYSGGSAARPALPPGLPERDYRPVLVPNGATLPFSVVDGVKVFHLIAEEIEHRFADGLTARLWGYNGRSPGPVIEAVEGERVRFYVTNRLPAATTVHFHGLFLPNGMDGVGGLTQRAIRPGETFKYEFTLRQHGTFMYHSHHDEMTQMAMGLTGMLVIHPRRPSPDYRVDRDFALMLGTWKLTPGTDRPDPNAMTDFNVLTLNAKVFPATEPLVCRTGERVRLRLGNLSAMDHHPIHLHGHYFKVTSTDGGDIPLAGQWPETTVLVPTGSTRNVELIADAPGDWALHCHMTHHVMNQMGHGIPSMLGVDAERLDRAVKKVVPGYMTMGQAGMAEMAEMHMAVPKNSIPMVGGRGPFDVITMGGMFTLLKVRATLPPDGKDPGPYDHPPGTVASLADARELARDGIHLPAVKGAK
jgi:FtsP/CotA-like multicopper oxidase with cupredoxin domain